MNTKIYHYVYKITNKLSGEYYIGLRSSNVIPTQDKYMGSGTRILNSINKYGCESFSKEILECFESRELASKKEEELVNLETLKDPLCLNLKTGGDVGISFYMPILKARKGSLNPNYGNNKKKTKDQIQRAREAMIASPVFQSSRKSLEYRTKISDIQSKTVIIFNSDFEILYSFKNCRVTAENLNMTRGNISNAIRDKRKIGIESNGVKIRYYVCFEENFDQYKKELKYNELSL